MQSDWLHELIDAGLAETGVPLDEYEAWCAAHSVSPSWRVARVLEEARLVSILEEHRKAEEEAARGPSTGFTEPRRRRSSLHRAVRRGSKRESMVRGAGGDGPGGRRMSMLAQRSSLVTGAREDIGTAAGQAALRSIKPTTDAEEAKAALGAPPSVGNLPRRNSLCAEPKELVECGDLAPLLLPKPPRRRGPPKPYPGPVPRAPSGSAEGSGRGRRKPFGSTSGSLQGPPEKGITAHARSHYTTVDVGL